MKVSFFEEFPNKKSAEKLKLINYPTKVYLAAPSIKEFNEKKKLFSSKYVKQIIYWPIVKESYWLSPFTDRKVLLRVMNECENMQFMWDAEIPKKRRLVVTNLCSFFKNKKLIYDYFKQHEKTIYTAEYFPEKGIAEKFLEFLGLMFKPTKFNNKVIKMVYSSMHDFGEHFIKKEVKKGVEMYGDKFMVGLGTIAKGVKGDEPLLSLKLLKRDLEICKNNNVNEVVIFRLNGLNEKYNNVIKKFI
ncbi:hypothetical protein D6777_01370 [Candidatus Woesearchaeota archaeon]|nr:MAG: hypothetical protein D6777_01370 [Candidatus Woesearchaeota archaeon]